VFALRQPHRLEQSAPFLLGLGDAHGKVDEDVRASAFPVGCRHIPFELSLSIAEAEGELRCTVEYDRDLFEPDSIRRLASHFRTLLQGIVDDPMRRVGVLPWLTPEEREQPLLEWSQTRAPFNEEVSLHELMARQAARAPQVLAVVGEGTA